VESDGPCAVVVEAQDGVASVFVVRVVGREADAARREEHRRGVGVERIGVVKVGRAVPHVAGVEDAVVVVADDDQARRGRRAAQVGHW